MRAILTLFFLLLGALAYWVLSAETHERDPWAFELAIPYTAADDPFAPAALRARMERPSLKYAYPKEGLTAWMDNLVVFKGAPNLENATKFLNFMLIPENAAMLTNFARFSAGVDGTEPFLDADLKMAPEVNPPVDAILEFVPPCEDKMIQMYDRIWTNLLK